MNLFQHIIQLTGNRMIRIHAENESQYFGIETLVDRLGFVFPDTITFSVSSTKPMIENTSAISVYFCHYQISHLFVPESISYDIIERTIIFKTNIIGLLTAADSLVNEDYYCENDNKEVHVGSDPIVINRFYESPFIDKMIDNIRNILKRHFTSNNIQYSVFRAISNPTICLTHDVDSIKGKSIPRFVYWMIKSSLKMKKKDLLNSWNNILSIINTDSDPHDTIIDYVDLEKKHGFNSTFFLMGLPFAYGFEGRRYAYNDNKIIRSIPIVLSAQSEIGFHPSRRAIDHPMTFKNEFKRVQSLIINSSRKISARNHYLKFHFPETWRWFEIEGIYCDSSVGWSNRIGFRTGSSTPFNPFDHEKNRKLKVWELPLIIMDAAVKGSAQQILEQCINISEECFKYDSPVTILWHTNRFTLHDYPNHSLAYKLLLEYFSSRLCNAPTIYDIIDKYMYHCARMQKERIRN
jgi:hypothetical protein